MASRIVKDLATRVPSNPAGIYAQPLGYDGVSAFSSPGMTMIGEADEREMSATFRLSDATEDDDGDIVDPNGCDLTRFRKNPVWLFHHDKDNPGIGLAEDKSKTLHVTISPRDIVAKCFFHCLPWKGQNLSQEIFDLVCRGALRGASVGFLPQEAKKRGHSKDDGYHFQKWLLTEASITPLPSHRDTLRMCLSRGYVKSLDLRTWLERFAGDKTQWANGIDLSQRAGATLGNDMVKRKLGTANIEISKETYKTLDAAKAFMRVRGSDASSLIELPTAWVFEQSDITPNGSQKTLAPGVVANLGYVVKAYDEKKDDDEEDDKDKKPTKNPVEKAEDDDAIDAGDIGETDDVSEETEAEVPADNDGPPKQGAQSLAAFIQHFEACSGAIGEHSKLNENPAVVRAIQKISAYVQKADEVLRATFAESYPGVDLESLMMPTADEPPMEDAPMDADAGAIERDPLEENPSDADVYDDAADNEPVKPGKADDEEELERELKTLMRTSKKLAASMANAV